MVQVMNLSLDDIRGLADIERRMDSGVQPFVVSSGHRMAVLPEIMKHFGLESGQSISEHLVIEILKANILNIKHKRESEEAQGHGELT